ncbi:MAG: 3-phosphoshikimate 1-carboxyvinyltransferase, partial [Clostridiales bacterium]
MDMLIRPSLMNGEMQAIASKSHAHRLLICSALADRKNRIRLPQSSADIEATIDCLQAMGANIAWEDGVCLVEPLWADSKNILLDCAESGSTLRFLLPVAAAHCSEVAFQGAGRLPKRPLDPLIAVLESHGISFSDHHLPLTIRGHLQAGQYLLPGNVSSQYITGLLLALPGLAGNSRIILTTEL